jgi:signal transduction histidine kinase
MPEDATGPPASPESAFQEYERPVRVRNYKLGALLAGIFVPAGATLDFFTHGWDTTVTLLPNRIICGVLLGAIWLALHFHPDTKRYRLLGFGVAGLPLLSISWMIYELGGASSTYYAGLNLIMLGSAILLRWTLMDSVIIVVLTLASYLIACFMRGGVMSDSGVFFNNIYFLLVTGVFLVAGSWYYNGVRRSEFDLRWRLDQNRAELEASNRKLKELDELKSRFFANISHELRTPLTLLVAPLETLLNRSVRLPEPEEKDLLSTMHGNAMRLLKLINDLLDLVRMEAGTMQIHLRKLHVNEFVQGLANAVRPVAQDKRVRIHTHVDEDVGEVMVDPEKVERICLNLLFNAIKFTAAGGFVEFSAVRDDKWLVLEVRDTGMGISPENLQHLFTRFFQADTSSQRKFQGMGIGLALVKELAEVQGGSVGATSELGKGTVMTVKLPFQVAEETAPDVPGTEEASQDRDRAAGGSVAGAAPPVEGQEWLSTLYRRAEMFPAMTSLQATIIPIETGISKGRKPKLLIADDEPDMLRFIRGQLSQNFEVLEAVDGRQAVEKAAQFLPEIILTDMMMPEMDGLQVCRELRNRTSTRSIPVVLLTARADEHTKIECLAAGASDFLAKPFSMTEVNVRLKNLVDSHTYQRELAQQKQQLEAALEQIKETEGLLLRNEKLASLGRMSAGLIHEINNPLNYARQGLHLLGQNTPLLPEDARAEFADTLKDVEEGVNRVVRIISDLRGFTRTTNETNQIFEIKPLAEKTMRFFSHEWKDGIRHETDVPDGLEMRGDPNHIVQVMVNLIQNAIDAMRTKTYPEGESPCIRISGTTDRGHVQIRVRDNGPGVPQSIRHQIFDPFFTTKDVGAGMGLGLAICHRVIAEHEGRIDLLTEPGSFTEFVLEFPSPDTIVETNYDALPTGHP